MDSSATYSNPFSRWHLAFILLAAVIVPSLAAAQIPAKPALSPQPREIKATELQPISSAIVVAPGGDDEDVFAARDLEKALSERGVHVAGAVGTPQVVVSLLRKDSPEGARIISASKLSFDPAMHDEGYILISRPGSATIIAETSAGVFYGAQTLKQLIEPNGTNSKLWLATIRDWPAMKYRGIQDDLSRGPFPTLAFQKHQLEIFAAHKVNLYSPYFEHTLAYSGDPLAAPPGSALTREEARELVAFARNLHITIVPEQEAFGHLHHILTYEKYAGVTESPHGHVLAPGQPETLPLINSWFTQIAEDFPSPFLHIGADETFELGTGRTRSDVEKRGLGPVYADFLTSIHTKLAPLHKRLLFWGDVSGSDPSAVERLPKDMIAIPWSYGHEDNFDHQIALFKKLGMETWVAPGDANWNVVYPLGSVALDNIAGFVGSGQRLGSTGELTAVWNDDGEGLFNLDWFGVLFGAASGWQPATPDRKAAGAAYQATFGRTFYGDTTGRIDEAQRNLIAASDALDVSDHAFFLDPFSKQGQAKAKTERPRIPAARLQAERAIELIDTALSEDARATHPNLRNRDALLAMELGARRIDFIGLKFQLSDEIATAYARAYALKDDPNHSTEARELLYSITSMNGRCQDLRDGYSMLKSLYKAAWLAENRPYWLDNVLVRYDIQIEDWQRRGDAINTLIDQWQDTHVLPTAAEAGIPPPPQP